MAPRIQRPQAKPPVEAFRNACEEAKEQQEREEEAQGGEEQKAKRQRSSTPRTRARSETPARSLSSSRQARPPAISLESLAQQQARTERMLQQILLALQPQGPGAGIALPLPATPLGEGPPPNQICGQQEDGDKHQVGAGAEIIKIDSDDDEEMQREDSSY